MSDNLLYWIFLGAAFALPFLVGLALMRKTGRLHLSFWLSTALSGVMTLAACLWWSAVNEDALRSMFGNAFFVISAVNLAVIEFFALLSIRQKNA